LFATAAGLIFGACVLSSGGGALAAEPTKSSSTVEEVIVTAQKRVENVQKVPLTVTPITGVQIERLHIEDLKDLNGAVPNVQILVNGGLSLSSMVAIRGIGVTNNPQVYAGTEAATVIDGVVQGTAQFNLASEYDLDRIEVLAGPQGTLFGANTTAGVVNIVTRQPTGQFGGYGTLTFGNYNTFNAMVAVNFPLIPDVLSGKISFSHLGRDGFFRNNFNGASVDTLNSNVGRLYLKWTPTNWADVTLISQYENVDIGSSMLYNISHPGEITFDPNKKLGFNVWDNVFTPNTLQTQSHTLTANFQTPIGHITSITNYSNYNFVDNLDFMDYGGRCLFSQVDGFCMNAFGMSYGSQWSQEVRDVFHPTSNIEWLVGVFAQTWTANSGNGGGITLLPFATGIHPDPAENAPLPGATFSRGIQDETQDDVSGFTQIYWDVTPRLRLQAGMRISWDRVHLFEANWNMAPANDLRVELGFNNLNGATFLGYNPGNPPTSGTHDWVNFGGRAGADYKITDDAMLYGFWARGFKTGGFNGAVTVAANIGPFNPEFVDTYEVGLKSQWFDHRVQFNIAGFYNNWDEMQVVQFTFANAANLNSVVLNAGKATTYGIEVSGVWVPIHGLTLSGNLGWLYAKYDQFLSAEGLPICEPPPASQEGCAVNYAGRDLPYAPPWTASLQGTYDFDLAGGNTEMTLQYTWSDSKWGNYTQVPNEHLPAVGLLNGNVSWGPGNGHWQVSLWGRNLLNNLYVATALDVPPLFTEATLGNPREFGAEFKFKF
jgi:iron complex outermembrane receptor protein